MTETAFSVSEPYAPRALRAGPPLRLAGWRLKSYGVRYRGEPLLPGELPGVAEILTGALPTPAVTATRPGVGWLILHCGRGMDYLVLGWWDRENEMPVRVWVRDEGSDWRSAITESFCVWDLEVMIHERDAWVGRVLEGAACDVEGYLADMAGAGRTAPQPPLVPSSQSSG